MEGYTASLYIVFSTSCESIISSNKKFLKISFQDKIQNIQNTKYQQGTHSLVLGMQSGTVTLQDTGGF